MTDSKTFALKYFKEVDGKPLWLAGMSEIGPFTTADPEKALSFRSEREAMAHPAYSHPLCLLDPCPHPLEGGQS